MKDALQLKMVEILTAIQSAVAYSVCHSSYMGR